MSLPVETFQDRAARRKAPKDLREGRSAINDMLHRGRPTLEERHAQRVMEDYDAKITEVDQRITGLDQGSRGSGHTPGAHVPAPKDGSGALRQALREAREARGE